MSEYHYNYGGSPSPGPGPGSPGPRPPRRDTDWGGVSWVLGMILTVAVGPLGLFLTFAHATGHDILGGFLQALFGGRKQKAPPVGAGAAAPKKPEAKKRATAEGLSARFHNVDDPARGANAKTVAGWILVALGLVMTSSAAATAAGVWALVSALCVALGGGALVLSGFAGKRKAAKFRRCFAVSGDRGVADMKKLAKTLGIDPGEADKLFSEMVDRGYYGERAYIDHERGLLVIDVEDMRDVYRREDEASARRTWTSRTRP